MEIPGYRRVLRSVLKSQIQHLVEQLAACTDEESVFLTASVSDGTLSHIGSQIGRDFLKNHDEIKLQFLGFCLKDHYEKKLEQQRLDNEHYSQESRHPSYESQAENGEETYTAIKCESPTLGNVAENIKSNLNSTKSRMKSHKIRFEPYVSPRHCQNNVNSHCQDHIGKRASCESEIVSLISSNNWHTKQQGEVKEFCKVNETFETEGNLHTNQGKPSHSLSLDTELSDSNAKELKTSSNHSISEESEIIARNLENTQMNKEPTELQENSENKPKSNEIKNDFQSKDSDVQTITTDEKGGDSCFGFPKGRSVYELESNDVSQYENRKCNESSLSTLRKFKSLLRRYKVNNSLKLATARQTNCSDNGMIRLHTHSVKDYDSELNDFELERELEKDIQLQTISAESGKCVDQSFTVRKEEQGEKKNDGNLPCSFTEPDSESELEIVAIEPGSVFVFKDNFCRFDGQGSEDKISSKQKKAKHIRRVGRKTRNKQSTARHDLPLQKISKYSKICPNSRIESLSKMQRSETSPDSIVKKPLTSVSDKSPDTTSYTKTLSSDSISGFVTSTVKHPQNTLHTRNKNIDNRKKKRGPTLGFLGVENSRLEINKDRRGRNILRRKKLYSIDFATERRPKPLKKKSLQKNLKHDILSKGEIHEESMALCDNTNETEAGYSDLRCNSNQVLPSIFTKLSLDANKKPASAMASHNSLKINPDIPRTSIHLQDKDMSMEKIRNSVIEKDNRCCSALHATNNVITKQEYVTKDNKLYFTEGRHQALHTVKQGTDHKSDIQHDNTKTFVNNAQNIHEISSAKEDIKYDTAVCKSMKREISKEKRCVLKDSLPDIDEHNQTPLIESFNENNSSASNYSSNDQIIPVSSHGLKMKTTNVFESICKPLEGNCVHLCTNNHAGNRRKEHDTNISTKHNVFKLNADEFGETLTQDTGKNDKVSKKTATFRDPETIRTHPSETHSIDPSFITAAHSLENGSEYTNKKLLSQNKCRLDEKYFDTITEISDQSSRNSDTDGMKFRNIKLNDTSNISSPSHVDFKDIASETKPACGTMRSLTETISSVTSSLLSSTQFSLQMKSSSLAVSSNSSKSVSSSFTSSHVPKQLSPSSSPLYNHLDSSSSLRSFISEKSSVLKEKQDIKRKVIMNEFQAKQAGSFKKEGRKDMFFAASAKFPSIEKTTSDKSRSDDEIVDEHEDPQTKPLDILEISTSSDYTCDTCDKSFRCKSKLSEHISTHTWDNDRYRKIETKENEHIHVQEEVEQDRNTREVIQEDNIKEEDNLSLQRNLDEGIDSGKLAITTPSIQRKYNSKKRKSSRRKYVMESRSVFRSKKPRRFSCLFCGKKFSLNKSLEKHIRWDHITEIHSTCSSCGSSITTMRPNIEFSWGDISNHLAKRNENRCSFGILESDSFWKNGESNKNETTLCESCKYSLQSDTDSQSDTELDKPVELISSSTEMIDKVETKNIENDKTKVVVTIDKEKRKNNESDNTRAGANNLCEKMFPSNNNKEMHIQTEHYGDIFECIECRKSFIVERNYRQHLLEVHAQNEKNV